MAVAFEDLGGGGRYTLADVGGGRADVLYYRGTDADDSFSADGANGSQIRLNDRVRVTTPGITQLGLDGLGGNDSFDLYATLAEPLPWGTEVFGGDGTDSVSVQDDSPGVLTVSRVGDSIVQATVTGIPIVEIEGTEFLDVTDYDTGITIDGISPSVTYDVTPLSDAEARVVASLRP